MRRFTTRPAKFRKPKNTLLSFLLPCLILVGCSSVSQKLNPDVFYKRDIEIEINGKIYDGVAVPDKAPVYNLKLKSKGVIDMIKITSCHREDIFEPSKEFWESGKKFEYVYAPIAGIEDQDGCVLEINTFEKIKGRHAWGTIHFINEPGIPAQTLCAGKYTSFGPASICQSKSGLIQKINFSERVKVAPIEKCNTLKTVNETEYTYTMPLGICNFYFGTKDGKFHRHTSVGYEGILIREVN